MLCLTCLLVCLACKQSNEQQTIEIALRDSGEKTPSATKESVIQEIDQNIRYNPEKTIVLIYYFSNLSGVDEYDYLSQALIDYVRSSTLAKGNLEFVDPEVLASKLKLKGISNVRNLSIGSVMSMARELNADYVITGNFRLRSADIILSATMRRVQDGFIVSEAKQAGKVEELFHAIRNLTDDLFTNLQERQDLVIETRPPPMHDPQAYKLYQKGIAAYKDYQQSRSVEYLNEVIARDPTFGNAYIYLMLAYQQLNYGKFREVLEQAAEMKDKFCHTSRLLVDMFQAALRNDLNERNRIAKDLLENHANELEPHLQIVLISTLHNQSGSFDSDPFVEALQKHIQRYPFEDAAYNLLGYAFMNRGDYENAAKYLNQYAVIRPNQPNPHDSLGDMYKLLGNYPAAEQEYKKALIVDKHFYYSYMNLLTIADITYGDEQIFAFSKDYFYRFMNDAEPSGNAFLQLGAAFLLLVDEIQYVDMPVLMSYVLYLARNGYSQEAAELTDKVYQRLSKDGTPADRLNELDTYSAGAFALMHLYTNLARERDVRSFVQAFPDQQRMAELLLVQLLLFNDDSDKQEYLLRLHKQVVDGLCEDTRKQYAPISSYALTTALANGDYKQASERYGKIWRRMDYQMRNYLSLFLHLQLNDIKDPADLDMLEENLRKDRTTIFHYNLLHGMLLELRGKGDDALKEYKKLYDFIAKNSRGVYNYHLPLLKRRIDTLEP